MFVDDPNRVDDMLLYMTRETRYRSGSEVEVESWNRRMLGGRSL